MISFKKGDGSKSGDLLKPGEWGITEDKFIMLRCPHETHSDDLPRYCLVRSTPNHPKNWVINEKGEVSPSIWFKDPSCGWHDFAKLEGWV